MSDEKLSQGESVSEESTSIEPKKPSFLTDSSQTSEESEIEFQMPEKFQGKSVEDVVKSYVELESLQGRQATKLSEAIAKSKQVEDKLQHLTELMEMQSRNQGQQSSQSDKGAEDAVDLNDLFYERGADVVEQIVRRTIGDVFTERDKRQMQENEKFIKQRDKEIEIVALGELETIASELDGGEIPPAVLNQIQYLDRTDPELDKLRSDPTLTPDRVREETRKLYQRAVDDIRKVAGVDGQPSQSELQAYNQAKKQAAATAPKDSARTGAAKSDNPDPRIEAMKALGWGFLSERSA